MATIRERNGTYQITVYSGFDLNGRRKRETTTFTPPKELSPKKKEKVVQAFAIDFENRVKNGLVLAGEKTTLREFVDRWREEYASQNLEPGTLEKYNAEIDDKILPMLGHMILTEIKPHNVNAFYVSMTKNGVRRDGKPGGYSKGTITKTANVLSSILKTAVDWEVINRNPCDKVRTHGEDVADKIKFFTPAQVSCFLEYIEKPYEIHTRGHSRVDDTGIQYQVGDYTLTRTMPEQLRVLFNLAVFSGLRKGEMLALQWSDIDFENSTVSVTTKPINVNSINPSSFLCSPRGSGSGLFAGPAVVSGNRRSPDRDPVPFGSPVHSLFPMFPPFSPSRRREAPRSPPG